MKSRKAIDALVARLLDQARAWNIFPTPVEAIVAAQRLVVVDGIGNIFAAEVLAHAPEAIRFPVQSLMAQGKCPLGLLDRQQRVVHIPADELLVRQRFGILHEVGHDLCPWQRALVEQQVNGQLDVRAAHLFEEEANYAAVCLLFQQEVFRDVAYQSPPSVRAIRTLAEQFGASLYATFWHYIEGSPDCVGGCVIEQSRSERQGLTPDFGVKQAFAARAFRNRYVFVERHDQWFDDTFYGQCRLAQERLAHATSSEGTLVLSTRRQEMRHLHYSFFGNSYRLFCLLHDKGP